MFTIRRRATSLRATTCSQQHSITRTSYARGTISTPMPPSTTRQPARPVLPSPQYYQAAEPTQTTATGTPVVPASYTVPVADAPASQPAQAVPEATYGDPYGFLYWLNSTRASYGLGPVNYDQNLSNWAAMNNSEQMARGLGHFVMGPAPTRIPPRVADSLGQCGWLHRLTVRPCLTRPSVGSGLPPPGRTGCSTPVDLHGNR